MVDNVNSQSLSKAESFYYIFICYFKFLAQSCHQAKILNDNWKSYSAGPRVLCTKRKIKKKRESECTQSIVKVNKKEDFRKGDKEKAESGVCMCE